MFEIGFWELIVVLIVGLLVLGPKRLPAAARVLGRYCSAARERYLSVKQEFQREFSHLDNLNDPKP